MRIHKVSVCGYKPIPFCAFYDKDATTVCWNDDTFSMTLPTSVSADTPMLTALMGANSTGKSSLLFALRDFFSNPTKLESQLFHNQQVAEPVIVEVTFHGEIHSCEDWHSRYCVPIQDDIYALTLIRGWSPDKRVLEHLRCPDGALRKVAAADKVYIEALLPKFRIILADPKPSDEAKPKKDSPLYDLIADMVEADTVEGSVVTRMKTLISEFESLVNRAEPANQDAWEVVSQLEASLSRGLARITPQKGQVKLKPNQPMTTVHELFLQGKVRIDDGVELDLDQHGLGLQRSFVVSILSAWCEKIAADSENDYVFAIEEPELYLHPHATRVLLAELEKIARTDQVVFTTHSSEFINRVPLHNVYIARRHLVSSAIHQPDLSGLDPVDLLNVQRYLREDRSDMLFARAVLLVEGQAELFALPAFAHTLNLDLDQSGISIVHVNGIENIKTYHGILHAFNIPHVALIDGDGDVTARRKNYGRYASDGLFVLDEDFEYLLADTLPEARFLEIVNECRRRKGQKGLSSLKAAAIDAGTLKKSWWRKLKEKFDLDVPAVHRDQYSTQKQTIKHQIETLADAVWSNGHLSHAPGTKQKAGRLVHEGKPLGGRVVGEVLTREEVEQMPIIRQVLESVIALAQN